MFGGATLVFGLAASKLEVHNVSGINLSLSIIRGFFALQFSIIRGFVASCCLCY